MAKHSTRDVRGRFTNVDTTNTAVDSDFDPMTGIDVSFPSDVRDSPYEMVRGDYNMPHAPAAPRMYAGPGPGARLRARRPEMVPESESVHTTYGKQGAVLRSASRDSGPLDPSEYLTRGMVRDTRPGAEEVRNVER